MTAEASPVGPPLGVYLLIGLAVYGVCALVWLFADGGQRIERARAELPTDDEPEERCTHPGCEQARELHRLRIRRQLAVVRARGFVAARARVEWTDRDDAQFADYARSIGGA